MKHLYFVFAFFTTITLLHLSTNISAQASDQKAGEKIVTIATKNLAIRDIFKSITGQTGLRFSYNNSDFNQDERINASFIDITVDKVLKHLFAGRALSWVYIDNVVRIGKAAKDQEPSIIPGNGTGKKGADSVPLINVSGQVVDPAGRPIAGATVSLRGQGRGQGTDHIGRFSFARIPANTILVVSSLGFESIQYKVAGKQDVVVKLDSLVREIHGIEVVSTGYQEIPKERSAGSFSKIDNKMLNQQVSSDVISRLDGMASGVSFQSKRYGGIKDIMIRGRGTFSDYTPLVIVDNFPYEGEISNINPNDVESITILKDASAASIWGSRAGNGVIVVTTKKGNYNRKLNIQLNTNLTTSGKPNLFYTPKMPVSDYVALEKIFFEKGMYKDLEESIFHSAISPVGELLIAKRDGLITPENADAQIAALATRVDIRNEYLKYYYRKPLVQRHSLSLNGGTSNYNYLMSFGYDKNLQSMIGNSDDRISLNFKNSYLIAKNLEFNASVIYTKTNLDITSRIYQTEYPYERLMDENGNYTQVTRTYRNTFTNEAKAKGLLDWTYKPLAEREALDEKTAVTNYVLNAGIKYSIKKSIGVQLLYQHEEQNSNFRDRESQDLYDVRNLINDFTQVAANGTITRPIPLGDILNTANDRLSSNSVRLQLSYNNIFWGKNYINAIAGAEVRETNTIGNVSKVYGFTEDGLTSVPVNHTTVYPLYSSVFSSSTVPDGNLNSDGVRRYISYYANGSYTWDNRITITASARKDGANLFGVNSNRKWNPLWSAGAAWNIGNESFYKVDWLPYLKLRATYGYTGSVGSASSYLRAIYKTSTFTGLKTATVTQPPNPDLKWEQQRIINMGLDFASKNKVISGSIEYYNKRGDDLILDAPIDPTIGFYAGTQYSTLRNYASMSSTGVDIDLSSKNIEGLISWQSRFVLSYTKNKILKTAGTPTLSEYLALDGSVIQGSSFGELYSYAWGGLDPANGDPIGYLSKAKSKDYASIATTSKPEDLVKNGPSTPAFYGSFQNYFTWKNFQVSVGINYRMGYYFRGKSYSFGLGNDHKDFAARWQKQGDENITNVPSIPATYNQARNNFYNLSEVLIQKADHIRLQFINVGYNIDKSNWKASPLKNIYLFVNFSNLGLIWKANKQGIDPDYQYGIPPPIATTFGAKVEF